MLMQKKQYAMPQHLVLCTDLLSSSESMLLRQESTLTLFYSNQTILQFCENWIDD